MKIQEASAGDVNLGAPLGDIELCHDVGGELARIQFSLLGDPHQGVGLVIPELGIGTRAHQDLLGAGIRQDGGNGLVEALFKKGVKHELKSRRWRRLLGVSGLGMNR